MIGMFRILEILASLIVFMAHNLWMVDWLNVVPSLGDIYICWWWQDKWSQDKWSQTKYPRQNISRTNDLRTNDLRTNDLTDKWSHGQKIPGQNISGQMISRTNDLRQNISDKISHSKIFILFRMILVDFKLFFYWLS